MNNALRRAALAVAISVAAVSPALAQDATTTLDVSATVTNNCIVSTTPVAFGDVDVTSGAAITATGGLSVTCTNATPWAAAADAGVGNGASLATRRMANGSNMLNYQLFSDEALTTLWGDGVEGATATIAGIGSGVAQARTIYGRVAGGQSGLPAGSYADTVQVTVTY